MNENKVEAKIQRIVEEYIALWRAAMHQANSYAPITVHQEVQMRQCITDLEHAKHGLPLRQHSSPKQGAPGWEVRSYLDAQKCKITEPPWRVKGLVVEGGASGESGRRQPTVDF